MAGSGIAGLPAEASLAARDTLGGATAVAAHLPDQLGASLLRAARDAFTHAMQISIAICAVVLGLAAIMAVVALRHARTSGDDAPSPAERRIVEDCAET